MLKEYDIIYADPPWRYEDEWHRTNNRRIERHYPTMDLKDIMAIQLPSRGDSVLFLWATVPKLNEAMLLMDYWGYTYRSHCVWDKKLIGTGYWFRNQHEVLLIGKKGSFAPPPEKLRVGSVIRSRRREHSRKPDIIRSLINKWYPDKTKLELFARQRFEGWDVWGLEAPETIQMNIGGNYASGIQPDRL